MSDQFSEFESVNDAILAEAGDRHLQVRVERVEVQPEIVKSGMRCACCGADMEYDKANHRFVHAVRCGVVEEVV